MFASIFRISLTILALYGMLGSGNAFAAQAPDFKLEGQQKQIKLSDYRGKIVYVDFWASWCQPCRKSFVWMNKMQALYGDDGFEIYAISMDNNKIQWMNAIDFNEFNWINVSELSYPDSKATVLYNVTGLPSTFLINREGDIVAKNLYGKTLETWLDNLL